MTQHTPPTTVHTIDRANDGGWEGDPSTSIQYCTVQVAHTTRCTEHYKISTIRSFTLPLNFN